VQKQNSSRGCNKEKVLTSMEVVVVLRGCESYFKVVSKGNFAEGEPCGARL
jgi:hypothetical protein